MKFSTFEIANRMEFYWIEEIDFWFFFAFKCTKVESEKWKKRGESYVQSRLKMIGEKNLNYIQIRKLHWKNDSNRLQKSARFRSEWHKRKLNCTSGVRIRQPLTKNWQWMKISSAEEDDKMMLRWFIIVVEQLPFLWCDASRTPVTSNQNDDDSL